MLQGPLREVLQPAGEFRALGGQLHYLSQQPRQHLRLSDIASSARVLAAVAGCPAAPGRG